MRNKSENYMAWARKKKGKLCSLFFMPCGFLGSLQFFYIATVKRSDLKCKVGRQKPGTKTTARIYGT